MARFVSVDAKTVIGELNHARERLRLAGAQALIAAVRDAEDSARNTTTWNDRRALDGTRRTIKGITSVDGFSLKGQLSAGGASRFLEFGTKAHGPVKAKRLVFRIGGTLIFAKWVRGITARKFMREARRVGEQTMDHSVDYFFNRAIHGR